jgi:hypothetical protein
VFEEIEKANDGREMILAPQNHPSLFLSFVWDTTEAVKEEEPEATPAMAVADAE